MRSIFLVLCFICFQAWTQELPVETKHEIDEQVTETEEQVDEPALPLIDKIIEDGKNYLGYKYRARLESGHVFDCSGYLSYIFGMHDILLARSSAEIAREVLVIPIEATRPGDLLFFKGRDINSSRIGHVAMVIENNGQEIVMIHASRQGIVQEALKDGYYTRRFVHAGRLPVFQEQQPDEQPEPASVEEIEEEESFP